VVGRANILIVEDLKAISSVIKILLTHHGYTVSAVVTTGEEAVDAVKSQHVDLVVMNIRLMGDVDGITAAETIREFSSVPIIFSTGYDTDDVMKRAAHARPSDYLIKPYTCDRLLDAIRDSLAGLRGKTTQGWGSMKIPW